MERPTFDIDAVKRHRESYDNEATMPGRLLDWIEHLEARLKNFEKADTEVIQLPDGSMSSNYKGVSPGTMSECQLTSDPPMEPKEKQNDNSS